MKLSATKRRDGSRFLAKKRKVFCFVKRKKDYCGGGKTHQVHVKRNKERNGPC